MTSCFRLSSAKYPVKSGAGAALHGGRWNPRKVEVIYEAASVSLAALEVLVHFSVLPRDFVLTEIRIPSDLAIARIDLRDLPTGWDSFSPSDATQDIGREWASAGQTAVLCVPSTIVPAEVIYVLNPKHSDFRALEFAPSEPFRFDSRLK